MIFFELVTDVVDSEIEDCYFLASMHHAVIITTRNCASTSTVDDEKNK